VSRGLCPNVQICYNCFQDFRHVRSPKASLGGASENSLTGHSAASLHDLSDLSTSDRTVDMTASMDRLPATSSNDTDGGNADDREDRREYDADDDRLT